MLSQLSDMSTRDVVTLGSTFGVTYEILNVQFMTFGSWKFSLRLIAFLLQSLSHIMDASMEDLARCPGIGERKVKRLYETFHEPFKRVVSNRTTVPETHVQPCPASDGKEVEDDSKRRKKGPEVQLNQP